MNTSAFAWLRKQLHPQRNRIAILLLLHILLGGSSVLYALLLKRVIDAATNGCDTRLAGCFMGLIALTAGQIALRAAERHTAERARSECENRLKAGLFGHLLEKDYAAVTAVHSGEWMNRLTSDTVVAANGYTEILPNAGGMLVKLVGALVLLLLLEHRFVPILLIGGVLMILLTYLFRKVLKLLHKTVQEKDGAVRTYLQEILGSMLVVRSFSAKEQSAYQAQLRMNTHQTARMQRNRFSNLCNIGFGSAMQGMYLLGIGYCASGILNGTVSYGTLIAVMQLVAQIQSPLANITGYFPRFYAMLASAERLMEAENYADDGSSGAKTHDEINRFYRDEFSAIAVKIDEFSYRDEQRQRMAVLRGLDFRIRKGEFIALTGDSGCGKSTLLKLLLCLYPLEHGTRLLECQEKEAILLTAKEHRLFAYVPQGNHLMSGTIREIVSFADRGRMADTNAVQNALRIACAEEFVAALPDGIETELGEHGHGLSEGQMQRLAIARALFADCPILLLDEATSALDAETEQRLLHNLREMTAHTVLIVTHRPAALEICDRVFRMQPPET
ncbi:MAG: ABC transporter ATP-binding protein [Oscillospiraceae bacterium]|nr:ABC transporter ATP-binding protein [Oscillospiraceae bacterium]